jgi:hypothetical protein
MTLGKKASRTIPARAIYDFHAASQKDDERVKVASKIMQRFVFPGQGK